MTKLLASLAPCRFSALFVMLNVSKNINFYSVFSCVIFPGNLDLGSWGIVLLILVGLVQQKVLFMNVGRSMLVINNQCISSRAQLLFYSLHLWPWCNQILSHNNRKASKSFNISRGISPDIVYHEGTSKKKKTTDSYRKVTTGEFPPHEQRRIGVTLFSGSVFREWRVPAYLSITKPPVLPKLQKDANFIRTIRSPRRCREVTFNKKTVNNSPDFFQNNSSIPQSEQPLSSGLLCMLEVIRHIPRSCSLL